MKSKANEKNPIHPLSDPERLVNILFFLSSKDLFKNISLVNKLWYQVVNNVFVNRAKTIAMPLISLLDTQKAIQTAKANYYNNDLVIKIEKFIQDATSCLNEIAKQINNTPYYRADITFLIKEEGFNNYLTLLHLLARIDLPELLDDASFQKAFNQLFYTLLNHHADINAISINKGFKRSVFLECSLHSNKLMFNLLKENGVNIKLEDWQILVPRRGLRGYGTPGSGSPYPYVGTPLYVTDFARLSDDDKVALVGYLPDKKHRLVSKRWRISYDQAHKAIYREKLQMLIGDKYIGLLQNCLDEGAPPFLLWAHLNEQIDKHFKKEIIDEIFTAMIDFFKDEESYPDASKNPWNIFSKKEITKYHTIDEFESYMDDHDLAHKANVLRLFLYKLGNTLKDCIDNKDLRSIIIDNLPAIAIRYCAKLLGNQIVLGKEMTLLHYAVAGNYLTAAHYLLAYFDEFKEALHLESDRTMPLATACHNVNPKMVELLVAYGADVNSFFTEDKEFTYLPLETLIEYPGKGPLGLPFPNFNSQDLKSNQLKIYNLLIDHGADVTLLDEDIQQKWEEFLKKAEIATEETSNTNKRQLLEEVDATEKTSHTDKRMKI